METKQYLVRLLGTRADWLNDMTEDEQKIMEDHFNYFKDLVKKEKCLMAGPCKDPVFGLVILDVASEAEAKEIMDSEPSVIGGIHTYDMNPFHLSLMSDYTPKDRYPEKIADLALTKEVTVKASITDVWNAWTTTEGVNSFFSPNAKVELRVGGSYEIYFLTDQPYGGRGSEYCKILSYLPNKMLSFDWNAPPHFGKLRFIHTRVIVTFEDLHDGNVKVTMSHVGFGEGEDWFKVYEYFDQAWGYVMTNFEKLYAEGKEPFKE